MRKLSLKIVCAVVCTALAVSVSVSAVDKNTAISEPIRCIGTAEKYIALTFDDGPHPIITAEILELLNEYGIKATFFVVGENAVNYPDTIKMVASLGHEIGNHTYSHCRLIGKSYNEIKDEISRANEAILTACGVYPALFRPPEGYCGKNVMRAASEENCRVILWNVDTRDWAHELTENICLNVKRNTSCGSIILFHDYTSGNVHTLDALRMLIPYLIGEGYTFCTVSELMCK